MRTDREQRTDRQRTENRQRIQNLRPLLSPSIVRVSGPIIRRHNRLAISNIDIVDTDYCCRYVHTMSICSSRSVDSGVMEDQARQFSSSLDTSYREESSIAEVRQLWAELVSGEHCFRLEANFSSYTI